MSPAIKFYQSGKERLVWDPSTNKAMAEFFGGEFETDDERVQQHLLKLGYKPMNDVKAAFENAAMNVPRGKPAVPSTEVGGATAEAMGATDVRNRDKTAFEAPDMSSPSAAVGGPSPAPARKRAAEKPRVK